MAAGSSGTSTLTVTPAGGYTGTVDWAIASSGSLTNACYAINNTAITGSTAVTTTLTIYTSAAACTSGTPLSQRGGRHAFKTASSGANLMMPPSSSLQLSERDKRKGSLLLAGLFCIGLAGLRGRRLRSLAGVLVITSVGFALSGCGSNATSATSTTAMVGSYTLTLTGTDSSVSTLTASSTITLTVD